MKEDDSFDYTYIIISDITPKDEFRSLVKQALLWTQNETRIVAIRFETIAQCEEKIQRREQNKLKRKEARFKKTYPILWNAN